MKRLIPLLLILAFVGCGKVEIKKDYYPDGKLMAEKKTKGKNAIAKAYAPDGTLLGEYHYKNGKLHGKTRIFYNNGKIFREIEYKKGDIAKMDQYAQDGEQVIKGR